MLKHAQRTDANGGDHDLPAIGTLVQLPLRLLDEDPAQPRQEFADADLWQLVESIRIVGVQLPLLVSPLSDGRYCVKDGARRRRAAIAAGLDTVPCLVEAPQAWLMTFQQQVLANVLRADLLPLDDAQALYLLWLGRQIAAFDSAQIAPKGATPTARIAELEHQLCELAGTIDIRDYTGSGKVRVSWQQVLESVGRGDWSPDRRKKHLAVLDVDPVVQDALVGQPVSARTLRDLAELPPAEQQALVELALADDSDDTGKALRRALDVENDQGRERNTLPPHTANSRPRATSMEPPGASHSQIGPGSSARRRLPSPGDDEQVGLDTRAQYVFPAVLTGLEAAEVIPAEIFDNVTARLPDGWDAVRFSALIEHMEDLQRQLTDARSVRMATEQYQQVYLLWQQLVTLLIAVAPQGGGA